MNKSKQTGSKLGRPISKKPPKWFDDLVKQVLLSGKGNKSTK